jgi:hypothetical protein
MCPHPELRDLCVRMQLCEDIHPGLDITQLEGPHSRLVLFGQVAEIPVLYPDNVRLAQGEVHLELHQATQCGCRIGIAGHHLAAAVEEFLADGHQQVGEDRLLPGKMTIDSRAAYPCRRSEVLKGHAVEPVDGEQGSRGRQQGLPPVLLRLAALG